MVNRYTINHYTINHYLDFGRIFQPVAGDDAYGDASGGPLVPFPDVAVCAADSDLFDADEDITRATDGFGAIRVEGEFRAGVVLDQGDHGRVPWGRSGLKDNGFWHLNLYGFGLGNRRL